MMCDLKKRADCKDGVGESLARVVGSRTQAIQGSREGDRFADMVQTTDPSHGSFDSKAEAGMRDAAVAAKIQEPFEGFAR